MADKNNNAKPIPVELLLSSIGQQVRVDLEAHRQQLLAGIGDREQRLAELRRRRQELLDREPARAEEPVPVSEPVGGGGLFDSAAPLAEDSDEDWLADNLPEESTGFAEWDAAENAAAPVADDGDEDWLADDLPDDLVEPEGLTGFAEWAGPGNAATPVADDGDQDWLPDDLPEVDFGLPESFPPTVASPPHVPTVTRPGPAELPSLADLMNDASTLLGDDWNF